MEILKQVIFATRQALPSPSFIRGVSTLTLVPTLLLGLSWAPGGGANAGIPTRLEPDYAEAVLALNGRDYDRAFKILDELTTKIPNSPEVLELMALVLKTQKKDPEALKVYLELIAMKKGSPQEGVETAPYHFEVGMIAFRDKDFPRAESEFQAALKGNFNPGASNFFLGTIAFQTASWAKAESAFLEVLDSNAEDLKLPADFYLGQVYLNTGYAAGASRHLLSAKKRGLAVQRNPQASPDQKKMGEQIARTADRALAPLQKNQFFANASLIVGYDSNVLSLPSATSDQAATGSGAVKTTGLLAAGYLSSSAADWQFVPSIRFSGNLNSTLNAAAGEFLSSVVSVYITHGPLERFSQGLKVEGTALFQNSATADTGRLKFQPFIYSASVGPYAKFELKPRMYLGAEFFVNPQSVQTDGELASELARSGYQLAPRLFWQFDRGTPAFNPTISTNLLLSQTKGTEYRSISYGASFSNLFYLGEKTRLTASFDYSSSIFGSRRDGKRTDHLISVGSALTQRIKGPLTLLADLRYTLNLSNIPDSYQFSRIAASLGLSYSF